MGGMREQSRSGVDDVYVDGRARVHCDFWMLEHARCQSTGVVGKFTEYGLRTTPVGRSIDASQQTTEIKNDLATWSKSSVGEATVMVQKSLHNPRRAYIDWRISTAF